MRTEDEIRLQRLAVERAGTSLINQGWETAKRDITTGQVENSVMLKAFAEIGLVFDILNWVLGNGSGRSLKNTIAYAENLSRSLKTGKFTPRMTRKKILSMVREAVKEAPEIHKAIRKDQEKLLEIDLDDLESKE